MAETDVERSCLVQLNINSSFRAERLSECRINVATRARQLEKIVCSIGFDLRRENPARGPRRFFGQLASLKQGDVAHAAQRQLARDRKSNHTAADDDDICAQIIRGIPSGHEGLTTDCFLRSTAFSAYGASYHTDSRRRHWPRSRIRGRAHH